MLEITENIDARGFSLAFKNSPLKYFHIVSVRPGTLRGNHVHEHGEFLCILGGKNLAKITLQDSGSYKEITIYAEYKVIKIPSGVKHIVENIGDKVFYLVCFSYDKKK